MKNFLFIVCSVFAFTFSTFSCSQKSQKAEVLKSDTIKAKTLVSVNVADTLEKLEAQNFVADTSYTSVQSSLVSAQNLAKQIDDATYKASLTYDRLLQKIRKLEEMDEKAGKILTTNVKPYNPTQHISDYWLSKRSINNTAFQDTSVSTGYKLSYQYRK